MQSCRCTFLTFIFFLCTLTIAQPGTVVNSFASPASNSAGLAWDGQHLFLLGLTDHIIYEIDPVNGQVLSTTPTGISGALGLTYRNGHFWVSVINGNTLQELDASGNVIRTIAIPSQQCIGIEWDGANFRVADSGAPNEEILEVDTLGNLVSSFLFPGDSPFGLTWDGSTIWCANNQNSGAATVYQFDPANGAVITSFPAPNNARAINGMAWDGQYLWLADNTNDMIYQVEGNPLAPLFGVIQGYLRDAVTGDGIAAIPLLDTHTDGAGFFRADSLQPGMYQINLRVDGFRQVSIGPLSLSGGDTAFVDTTLTPIGLPFRFRLLEQDGQEWFGDVYRDSLWRFYEIPLQRIGKYAAGFLDSPLDEFILEPLGGGGVLNTEIRDWIDRVELGGHLIDDFDDGNIDGWELVIATNGSDLAVDFDPAAPDGSPFALQLTHNNTMGAPFIGFLADTFAAVLPVNPDSSLRFWLRGADEYPLTAIGDQGDEFPGRFYLEQNSPNPFNSSTHLRFRIAEFPNGASGFTELIIYDVLGREIIKLVSERLSPGSYELTWDGRDAFGKPLGSGVYYARLKSGKYLQTRKMVLLR